MIGLLLKLMLTRGVSMKRWNNFPRIEDISLLDNSGFVIHVALFLAQLEEKSGQKVDKEFIIKNIIFTSFSPLIISDINSGTINYINKEDTTIFQKVQQKGYDFLFNIDEKKYIKEDILNTINNEEKVLELKIIQAAKKYVGLTECNVNAKIYPYAYEIPLSEIKESLIILKKDLPSLEVLLSNNNYEKYLEHIRRLIHAMRWSIRKRDYPISVMAHLYITTFIVYIIGMIENHNGASYDIEELMLRTIYHDIPEAITGDIVNPTKMSVEGFADVLEKVEISMMNDYVFSNIEDDLRKNIENYILHPFKGENGKIAKCADNLSALFEAEVEDSFDKEISLKLKKKLNKIDFKSIDYFLKDIMDDFGGEIFSISL